MIARMRDDRLVGHLVQTRMEQGIAADNPPPSVVCFAMVTITTTLPAMD